MANRARGEVDLELGGESLRLVLTLNAICEIEEAFDCGIGKAFARLDGENVRMSDLRVILVAAAQKHHPGMDAATLGDMINIQDANRISQAIAEMADVAAPDVPEGDATGKKNPRGSTRRNG